LCYFFHVDAWVGYPSLNPPFYRTGFAKLRQFFCYQTGLRVPRLDDPVVNLPKLVPNESGKN